MPLTSFGKRLTILTSVLAISSIFFTDALLAAAAIIITLLLGNEWIEIKSAFTRLKDEFKLEAGRLSLKMVAGQIEDVKVKARSRSKFRLHVKPPFDWCTVTPYEIQGDMMLTFKFHPELAGEYVSDGLPINISSKHVLAETGGEYPFPIEVKVYPKVLPAVAAAIELIVKAGSKGVGDQPVEARGKGLEYAGTREYLPGDSLRRVDHKATAKRGVLMMKEFYAEAGLMAHLIYDVRATGPRSRDELASTFLNTALGFARSGAPFGLTIHDGEETLLHLQPSNPTTALEAALKHVLNSIEVEPEDLDVLLEPRISAQAKLLMMKLKASPLKPFIEASIETLREPYMAVKRLAMEFSSSINAVAITGLTGKLTPYIELSKTLAYKMGMLKLISPCKPWLEAETLEDAYRLHTRWSRAKKLLETAGIKIGEEPTYQPTSVYAAPAATMQTSVQGKICSSCGLKNSLHAENFCVKCGQRLGEISV